MNDPASLLRARLIEAAGGYLRNTMRLRGITCAVCSTPVAGGYNRCLACKRHSEAARGDKADHVGTLAYAIETKQSHYLMRMYKASRPIREHQNVVGMLVALALHHHVRCLNHIAANPVSHWCAVPSLPTKPGEHPLRSLLRSLVTQFPEMPLHSAPTAEVVDPRALRGDHFATASTLPHRAHVLVVEDTWVQGGHAQSAALAVRKAGAATVSILSIARFLRPTFGSNAAFIEQHLTEDYEPLSCPWTTGRCPP
ncbi:hypothetical protein BAY61_00995 [Prauserella marina]|uniref:Uncharacterized protein n=1 Tax=Prauserella marina TaxID=530584 RepID=A0A222VIS7_9PSEU|nr:hypothetical protein [Prauserella marina]ASR33797.1 hypothetical protein BAY61_00995 [Prauserella marina]PWV82374.1 hypothetical protein DES30_102615 [Prauserella marina]SDC67633.1 hypothetical protein SAMN05421630_103151 [Prauserella marina]